MHSVLDRNMLIKLYKLFLERKSNLFDLNAGTNRRNNDNEALTNKDEKVNRKLKQN